MGTPATMTILDDGGAALVRVMFQSDGYPEGWPKDVAEFIRDAKIVNGYSDDQDNKSGFYNGMGGFAAAFISHFKQKFQMGGFYISNLKWDKETYHYVLYEEAHFTDSDLRGVCIEFFYDGESKFKGHGTRFLEWVEEEADGDA